MQRNVTLEEISDGRLYTSNDMVKADCNGCSGCSKCCHGMGDSIILDPYDVNIITAGLNCSFEQLVGMGKISLNVVDGVILPNMTMQETTDACAFLDETGRCSIHSIRPGFCRMFPLGRYYDNDTFYYILQVNECPYPNKTKVKIRKWLDMPELSRYEKYVNDWHRFILSRQELCMSGKDEKLVKNINMYILSKFFVEPYGNGDFYDEFYKRLQQAEALEIIN